MTPALPTSTSVEYFMRKVCCKLGTNRTILMGVFTLQKLANTTNKVSPIFSTAAAITMIVWHLAGGPSFFLVLC